jgi:protein-S-isoprenylcysteine O-methyltransferase Ste14
MKIDRETIWRVWLPLIVGLWALGFVFESVPGRHGLARWIGLLLGLIGLGGVILARYTLGRSFSLVPKANQLVTCGIYSRIRNPIYVFGMIAVVGMVLMVGRPQLLVILAVLVPMQIIRARKEARVLEDKFGEEYREYRRRTWF